MASDTTVVEPTPVRVGAGMLLAWIAFWLLMISVGVQEELRDGGRQLWRPVINELTAALAATAIALTQWHVGKRLDALLREPRRWFLRMLVWTPLVALGFVGVVYSLRLAVLVVAGQPVPSAPSGAVVLYEVLKFSIFYVLFSGVQFGVRSYMAWHGERLRAERHERLSQQAQLLQLTQQLQPHFLFNALNTVSSLIHRDPDLADTLLTQLAALLRAATDVAQRPEQPLADELKLLRGYTAIMSERFGDRVQLHWQIDDKVLACPVPTLGLQPLLENCFRHVVEPRRVGTEIIVRTRRDGTHVVIDVEDDGGVLAAVPRFGVGLGNLQRRLEALHGAQASVQLRARDGGGVIATVRLPCAC
jgi:two-component system LytT family sensor kinase